MQQVTALPVKCGGGRIGDGSVPLVFFPVEQGLESFS